MSVERDELETLLQAAVSDPVGTCGGVLRQVLDQLLAPDTTPETAGAGPEAVVAGAIARRLRGLFEEPQPRTSDRPTTVQMDAQAAYCEELMDRNSSLAAALGACNCWGAAPDCPICEGEGISGWMLPDGGLFAAYVGPALTVMTGLERNPAAADGPDENHRRETEDDHAR
jgi:hypothetical protein